MVGRTGSAETLSDYLAKPVHHLPEYPQFLKNLLEYTPEEHPDYETLYEALSKVRKVIKLINDKKQEEDNQRHIQEIQDKLIGYKVHSNHRSFSTY